MKQRLGWIVIGMVALGGCKEEPSPASTGGPAVGSGAVGSAAAGSAAVGSAGSADAGSANSAGSADAGSANSAGSAAGSADAGSAAAGSAAAPTTIIFAELDHEAQVDVMKTKVMPAMKAAFQQFDGKEFAKFTCKTCHGNDAKERDYEMPNPGLSRLDFAELEAGKHRKAAEFMGKVVKPEMARILGEAEYSDDHPDGFGCLDCHLTKE
ncbi:MAG: hypothetical protein R2939_06095 [Kofleriaceae bacterium]